MLIKIKEKINPTTNSCKLTALGKTVIRVKEERNLIQSLGMFCRVGRRQSSVQGAKILEDTICPDNTEIDNEK